MLSRAPSPLHRPHPTRPRPHRARALRHWLEAPGSLTARLRTLGSVRVQVCRQGSGRLGQAERRALGLTAGHIREVLLLVDDQPAVWARSVTSHRALRGPWRALKGLGSRPLAELLFSAHRVSRGPLHDHPWPARGDDARRARRHWGLSDRSGRRPHPPVCARASVFRHHGAALRVMEAFAPWLACRTAGPRRLR